MSKLTTKDRKAIPKQEFGIPSTRSYPMPDKAHAANAKARAKQMLDEGKLSRSTYNHIVAVANRKLGPGHHS